MRAPSAGIAALVLLLSAACSLAPEVRTLPSPEQPMPAGSATRPARALAVLVAPIGSEPLTTSWPTARDDLASELAGSFNSQGGELNAEAFVQPALPAAGDPTWNAGIPASAARAHLVLLLRVLGTSERPGSPGPQGRGMLTVAEVDLQVLDRTGREVLRKRAIGETEWQGAAKLSGPAARPTSVAAARACDNALLVFTAWLRRRADAAPTASLAPQPGEGIDLAIDSEPAGADILVDGAYRGTTPQSLRLPAREATLRLERQGHQPWERRLVPGTGMVVRPVLLAVQAAPREGDQARSSEPSGSATGPAAPVPPPYPAPAGAP